MPNYKIKNLNTLASTEVRIYSVDATNLSTYNPGFTEFDPASGSAGIKLQPFYNINYLDPISHAGLVSINNLTGSTVTSNASGSLVNYPVESDESLVQVLNNIDGLEVVELQPWTPAQY